MEYKKILLEEKNGVGRIVINQPPMNIIDIEMMREMENALEKLAGDIKTKVIVLSAAGDRFFSAGVSIQDHLESPHEMVKLFLHLCVKLLEVEKPTLALVNGDALGGGLEIIEPCDMLIASEKAKFGQPEIKLGATAGPGLAFLPRLIGRAKACELLYTGENFSAHEMERLGFVNRVAPNGELEKVANDFIAKLLSKSGMALSYTKRALLRDLDLDVRKALIIAMDIAEESTESEDGVEGLRAFLDKRKPIWKNG
jgi:cyclohexa-1,5-dienecarbonyl-CoA hydratase